MKYLTRLRIGASHLCENKFKQSFQDTLNPFRSRGLDVETNTYFFLYYPLFSNNRCTILSTVNDTNSSFSILTHILLFGKASLDIFGNTLILNATINYIAINRSGETSAICSSL